MVGRTPAAVLLTALCSGFVSGLSEVPVTCLDSEEYHSSPGPIVLRAVGEVWTEQGCIRGECRAAPDGTSAKIVRTSCSPSPFPDCQLVSQNVSAEFPDCCPEYLCPGRCFSRRQQRWFDVGETWTKDGCLRAECIGTDTVGLLPCGLIGLRPGCRAVPGDPDAEYPACCHQVKCDLEERPCYVPHLDRHFAVGERWTLPNCSGQATCGRGGSVEAFGCPLEATDTPGCGLDNGDLRFGYPRCCPKITCRNCYSQRLDRYLGPGDSWTGSSCTRNTCEAGPREAVVTRELCSPPGELPYPDCVQTGEDLERGNFPHCCPRLRCPGRCQDGPRWYSVGEQWDGGCTRAICVGTDRVERLSCPGQRYDSSRPDCRLVEGNSSAAFPLCCDSVVCDTPLDVCRDSAGASRAADSVWTERGCVRSRCEIAEGGVAVVRRSRCQPPPSADCRLVEPNPADGADYPYCCPTYLCPGRCYSPVLDRWFFEGDRWAEGGCFESFCESTGTVTQTRCPFVSARRPGCRVVAGDPAAKYPGCCRRVVCQPGPYDG